MDALPINVAVGRAIRRIREERGISQEELGHMTGLHRNHVGQIERAELNPTIKSIELIAIALGIRASAVVAMAEEIATQQV